MFGTKRLNIHPQVVRIMEDALSANETARSLQNAKRRLKISFFNHGSTDPFQEYDDAFR